MAEEMALKALPEERVAQVVGVFRGPWDTGRSARDGAVLGFENVFEAFSTAAEAGELELLTAEIGIFRDYRLIREFLAGCDAVYANCGPWAALLYLVREREQLNVRIIREVRTVGWVGYIWQEEVAGQLARPGDQRVFPSRYARDIWDAVAPDVSHSRIYYPMVRRTSVHTPRVARASGTVGFFSVLSQDKGFAYLPGVISRMLAGGHRIERLILAGEQADPALYVSVVKKLSDIGVAVSFRGGLPNSEVRELMAGCDCIFFLSVSSIESLGRVIIEASEQGVPVVTADFGAARDLVCTEYRIPVKYLPAASGHCDSPFPLAQLNLLRWEPPASLSSAACFLNSVGEYMVDAQTATDILCPPLAELPAKTGPVSFSFQCHVNGLALAHCLLDEPAVLRGAPMHELLDLGGTLKQFLLSRGYNPRVSFISKSVVSRR
jgi:glycosyltransferase involved in cell wall biosynthesis